jgi:hypothetical protein
MRFDSTASWVGTTFRKNLEGRRVIDVHGSVDHNTNLIEITKKMQLFRTIYYSIVP